MFACWAYSGMANAFAKARLRACIHHSVFRLPAKKHTIAFLPLALTACTGGILAPEGPIARAEQTTILDSLIIMLAIVVPTILAALTFAWWFRASNTRAKYRPNFAFSGQLELLIWSVPILTIVFLGGLIWVGAHQLDPAQPLGGKQKPVNIQAVSLDWKWLFIYPDQGVATVNDLPMPAGTPIHIAITSASVMNAFFIPQLGSMIYAMNGMVTQLNLQADHPGDYMGLSSHYSGDGFADMHFTVHAMSPASFANWVTEARKHGPDLTRQAYATLARPSGNVASATYKSIDASMFGDIATQKIPPADGPANGAGTTKSHQRPEG
jgi:cytochrome o ubiquinol oxidase subunit 2